MTAISQTSEERVPGKSSLSANASESLYRVADEILRQVIEDLLGSRGPIQTDAQLTHPSELIPGSTIGKHLRHLADHFRLLLQPLERDNEQSKHDQVDDTPLQVCYDTRSRNVLAETSHAACLASFIELRDKLKRVTDQGRVASDRPVHLTAVTPFVVQVDSTFGRELWFTALHGTHHLALLRVIVCGELQLDIAPTFGVAPSTLTQRSSSRRESGARNPGKDNQRRLPQSTSRAKL